MAALSVNGLSTANGLYHIELFLAGNRSLWKLCRHVSESRRPESDRSTPWSSVPMPKRLPRVVYRNICILLAAVAVSGFGFHNRL